MYLSTKTQNFGCRENKKWINIFQTYEDLEYSGWKIMENRWNLDSPITEKKFQLD